FFSLRLSYAPVESAVAIGHPSERAVGGLHEVFRIDCKGLIVLAGQARLLECLDRCQQCLFLFAIRVDLGWIQIPCDQLSQFGLGYKLNGNIQHMENAFVAFPANCSPELVPINVLEGHGPPFPTCAVSLTQSIALFSVLLGGCRREQIFDEESITCRRTSVRNLLISRTTKSIPDRLLG